MNPSAPAASQSRLIEARRLTAVPARAPTRLAASPLDSLCSQTSAGNSPRHRGPSSSEAGLWLGRGGRAAEPAGRRRSGGRRLRALPLPDEQPYAPRSAVGECSPPSGASAVLPWLGSRCHLSETTKKQRVSCVMGRGCLSVILPVLCSHSPPVSRVEESHDRMSAMNAPKGAFIVRSQWRAVELRCCVFVLQDPLLSSAPSE